MSAWAAKLAMANAVQRRGSLRNLKQAEADMIQPVQRQALRSPSTPPSDGTETPSKKSAAVMTESSKPDLPNRRKSSSSSAAKGTKGHKSSVAPRTGIKTLLVGALYATSAVRTMAQASGDGAALDAAPTLPQAPPTDHALVTKPHGPLDDTFAPVCPADLHGQALASAAFIGDLHKLLNDPSKLEMPGRLPYYPAPPSAPYQDIAPMRREVFAERFGDTFGSKVAYLTPAEREHFRINCKDGILYRADGKRLDTSDASTWSNNQGRAIFIMDHDGNIFASNEQIRGHFHHSSLNEGKPVAAAGEFAVKDGVLMHVNPLSGHYLPTSAQQDQLVSHLHKLGVTGFTVEAPPEPGSIWWLVKIALGVTACIAVPVAGLVAAEEFASAAERRKVSKKLATLSPDALKLVRLAALCGVSFKPEMAKVLLNRGEDAMAPLLREVVDSGLFTAPEENPAEVLQAIAILIPEEEEHTLVHQLSGVEPTIEQLEVLEQTKETAPRPSITIGDRQVNNIAASIDGLLRPR